MDLSDRLSANIEPAHLRSCSECVNNFLTQYDENFVVCVGEKINWRDLSEDEKVDLAVKRSDEIMNDLAVTEWMKVKEILS